MTRDELLVRLDAYMGADTDLIRPINLIEQAGFALVPIEPTEAMIQAAVSCERGDTVGEAIVAEYRAMLKKAAEEG